MKRTILPVVILAFFIHSIQGQDKEFRRIFRDAEFHLLEENYDQALKNYQNLLSTDPDNGNLNFYCGFCLMKSGGDVAQTIKLLEMAALQVDRSYKDGSYKERNAPTYTFFLLGKAQHLNNQYDRAIPSYEMYLNSLSKNETEEINYVQVQIRACELAKRMVDNPVGVSYQELGADMQLTGDILNPVISGEKNILVFLQERNNSVYIMDSRWEEDAWAKPKVINPQLDLPGDVYPVSISHDGSELYLVSGNFMNKDIYVSHYNGKNWSNAFKLNNKVNTKYNETHACVSRDGQTLVFTSDRKGGMGGIDIYYAQRIDGDDWDNVINMGAPINTVYNEETPFLTEGDNQLYFSSEGHGNIGGYDIFFCNLRSDGSWGIPNNVGYPLNTTDDDLFFNPGWEQGQALYSTSTNNSGEEFAIYQVQLIGHEQLSANVNSPEKVPERKIDSPEEGDIKQKTSEASTESTPHFRNNNLTGRILFDFNKSSISEESLSDLEKIWELLDEFEDIRIELTGHTDSKGSEEFNIRLSEQRAQVVADFLISKNIDRNRIKVKGAGEYEPIAINHYNDGSDSPAGRRLNRNVNIDLSYIDNTRISLEDIQVPNQLIPSKGQEYTIVMFQSTGRVTSTPAELMDEQVTMLTTEDSYAYTLGSFKRKDEAYPYLDKAIEQGYPDAKIVQTNNMEFWLQDNISSIPQLQSECYTIQIMALKNPKEVSYFNNLEIVRRFEGKDGLYRFVAGEYGKLKDANTHLPQVKSKGYEDAVVVPCSRYSTEYQWDKSAIALTD